MYGTKRNDIMYCASLGYAAGRSTMRRYDHEKLSMTDAAVIRLAIQQGMSRSDESRYDHRLHGLLLRLTGLR